jgi:hypothetical protein
LLPLLFFLTNPKKWDIIILHFTWRGYMSQPIICPHCDKRNIAIITEYHKANWAHCLQMLCILITAMLLLGYIGQEAFIGIAIAGGFVIIGIQCYIAYVESKTHIQCICKDCGYVWIHDSLY